MRIKEPTSKQLIDNNISNHILSKAIKIITEEENEQIADNIIEIPDCDELIAPIIANIPLQLLSYHIANKKGCDIDQPRNLAKSVTVE